MNHRFPSIIDAIKRLSSSKYPIAFLLAVASYHTHAAPSNMGVFTTEKVGFVDGKWQAKGRYTAAGPATGKSSWGAFTITREEMTGYQNNVSLQPSNGATGRNGVEILNNRDIDIDQDRFKYTFTITPDESTSVHTIKIGQASYTTSGNSEIARQTLNYTQNPNIDISAQAVIKNNPSVPYFYDAMGDYFMGSRVNATQLRSQDPSFSSGSQLRVDSSDSNESGLYYYNISKLAGVTETTNPYTPTLNSADQVTLGTNTSVLPPNPTFENIIKSIKNGSSYSALNTGDTIFNNSSYVSYGIANAESNYVIDVKNAISVTLTYEGIMNGNIAIDGGVVGETFNEWISFGVESEPLYYLFSGTVFDDNGGIDDSADADKVGTPYINNSHYFNGVFNPAPASPAEKGIAGSTVKLTDCANPETVYATQALPTTVIGEYRLRLPANALNRSSKVCLVEDREDDNYPIRTTISKKSIDLGSTPNKYHYDNNNFGRVIAKNAALVLTKYQYINNCPATLDYLNIKNRPEDTPLTGFSTRSIDKIIPGQCIAYKIQATNRSNLEIKDFVMQDKLQESGVNNATVSSVLTTPTYHANDYASDSVAVGKNDVPIKTKALTLAASSSYDFYFNTKHGTTQSN